MEEAQLLPHGFEDDVLKLLSEQEDILAQCEERNLPIVSAADIQHRSAADIAHRSIESLCAKWKSLEEQHNITLSNEYIPPGCRFAGSLITPRSLDAAEDTNCEYAQALKQLLSDGITRFQSDTSSSLGSRSTTTTIENSGSSRNGSSSSDSTSGGSTTLSRVIQWAAGDADIHRIPELSHAHEATEQHTGRHWSGASPLLSNQQQQQVQYQRLVVYSFTVFNISRTAYSQRIDLSEQQTLADLQSAIDCPHAQGAAIEDGFFFINGRFFTNTATEIGGLFTAGLPSATISTLSSSVAALEPQILLDPRMSLVDTKRAAAQENTARIVQSLKRWFETAFQTESSAIAATIPKRRGRKTQRQVIDEQTAAAAVPSSIVVDATALLSTATINDHVDTDTAAIVSGTVAVVSGTTDAATASINAVSTTLSAAGDSSKVTSNVAVAIAEGDLTVSGRPSKRRKQSAAATLAAINNNTTALDAADTSNASAAESQLPANDQQRFVFPIVHKLNIQSMVPAVAAAATSTTGNMRSTTLRSLRDLQIGAPIVYVHCQGCEHVIYFSDCKLCQGNTTETSISTTNNNHRNNRIGGSSSRSGSNSSGSNHNITSDCNSISNSNHHSISAEDKSSYPLQTYRSNTRKRKCSICALLSAKFVVFGDRLVDQNPCFFCEYCYHMLHYSSDNQLMYDDFSVFPYIEDA